MPRKAKEETKIIEEKAVNKEPKSKKNVAKKTSSRKTVSKTSSTKVDKSTSVEIAKITSTKMIKGSSTKETKSSSSKATKSSPTKMDKTVSTKVVKLSTAKNTKKASPSKKPSTKKYVSKEKTSSEPKRAKNSVSKKSVKNSIEVIEYYDLPYRYNQTVVKILAQTPTTLFVYWDISNEDKNNYIKQYGEYFFNNTKPVLLIHNITKNYSYEIDINDFANSWYLHVKDSNCNYKIELGRRPINKYASIPNNYLFISSSNDIESPNDHILFKELPDHILFKNVKTDTTTQKAIVHYLVKLGSSYNIKNFYKEMYKDENINFDKLIFNNSFSSSTFK